MGVRNLRAICPNCGGKIATQPKGLGHFTWANSWFMVQTGSECQHCGVALSGRVAAGNKAILAEDADKSWWEREAGSKNAESSDSGQTMRDAIRELQADKGLAFCAKERKAVRPVDPEVVPVKRGKRLELRGKCPDCGEIATWRPAKGTTQEEMAAILSCAPESPSPSQSEPAPSNVDQLERLAKLRSDGALSDAEFEAEKRKLLGA